VGHSGTLLVKHSKVKYSTEEPFQGNRVNCSTRSSAGISIEVPSIRPPKVGHSRTLILRNIKGEHSRTFPR
ncbi:MAG: hypothetical protein ABI263_03020, partial [Gelidibacter sp.]